MEQLGQIPGGWKMKIGNNIPQNLNLTKTIEERAKQSSKLPGTTAQDLNVIAGQGEATQAAKSESAKLSFVARESLIRAELERNFDPANKTQPVDESTAQNDSSIDEFKPAPAADDEEFRKKKREAESEAQNDPDPDHFKPAPPPDDEEFRKKKTESEANDPPGDEFKPPPSETDKTREEEVEESKPAEEESANDSVEEKE
jgi:hypothetical protein